jgi:hypothetical protein
MTDYPLNGFHNEYKIEIPKILDGLKKRYPMVELDTVELCPFKEGDHSLGNATKKGRIQFNPYWFTKPIAVLNEASRDKTPMKLKACGSDSDKMVTIPYHGAMISEPHHVVTHEFGHLVSDAIPQWEAFADSMMKWARQDPHEFSPGGYSLTNPAEFFAELFAETEIFGSIKPRNLVMKRFLCKHLQED